MRGATRAVMQTTGNANGTGWITGHDKHGEEGGLCVGNARSLERWGHVPARGLAIQAGHVRRNQMLRLQRARCPAHMREMPENVL
eukprot:1478109-Pyramimonas_sp.AAC.1